MNDDYAGPDRRAQGVALAEAVGLLDEHVVTFTAETQMLRIEVARERRWRYLVVGVVAVLLPIAVSNVYGVFQSRHANDQQDDALAILRTATGSDAQAANRYYTALLVCDLKDDVRIALRVLHPEAAIPPPAGCPPEPPPTTTRPKR